MARPLWHLPELPDGQSAPAAHRLCSKLFDGGKEQSWNAALPVKTNQFMIYYRFINKNDLWIDVNTSK